MLNGQPMGDFNGVPDASTLLNLVGVGLSAGFSITGDIHLDGKFAGGDEHSKVEIQAGCAPAAG